MFVLYIHPYYDVDVLVPKNDNEYFKEQSKIYFLRNQLTEVEVYEYYLQY